MRRNPDINGGALARISEATARVTLSYFHVLKIRVENTDNL